jgi:hypothetical protein
MRTTARLPPTWKALTLVVLIAIGCDSGDARLAEVSRQSADRQAEQNRLVETNNRQVLEATNKLVEADAKSRTENNDLHRQIESERSGVNRQRDALEQERREIALDRHRDPIIAESIQGTAAIIAAILPLLVCLFLLHGLFHRSDEEAIADVLIEDLVSQHPLIGASEATLLPESQADLRLAAESSDTSDRPCEYDSRPQSPGA